jgi:hypothetical protein
MCAGDETDPNVNIKNTICILSQTVVPTYWIMEDGPHLGDHGFDPAHTDMSGIFIATGPGMGSKH